MVIEFIKKGYFFSYQAKIPADESTFRQIDLLFTVIFFIIGFNNESKKRICNFNNSEYIFISFGFVCLYLRDFVPDDHVILFVDALFQRLV